MLNADSSKIHNYNYNYRARGLDVLELRGNKQEGFYEVTQNWIFMEKRPREAESNAKCSLDSMSRFFCHQGTYQLILS